MIEKFVFDLAAHMGIALTEVSLTNGNTLGCKGVYLLDICSNDESISTLIFHSDIVSLEIGGNCIRLETKIRSVLSQLLTKLENSTTVNSSIHGSIYS